MGEMWRNVNGYYDGGFTTNVDSDGGVRVTSQHFAERVTQERAFPLVGKRSVRVMRRIVERAKKRLQKQEQRLIEIKEEFKW